MGYDIHTHTQRIQFCRQKRWNEIYAIIVEDMLRLSWEKMRDLEGITYTDTQTLRFTAGTKRNTKLNKNNNNKKKGPGTSNLKTKMENWRKEFRLSSASIQVLP